MRRALRWQAWMQDPQSHSAEWISKAAMDLLNAEGNGALEARRLCLQDLAAENCFPAQVVEAAEACVLSDTEPGTLLK